MNESFIFTQLESNHPVIFSIVTTIFWVLSLHFIYLMHIKYNPELYEKELTREQMLDQMNTVKDDWGNGK